MLNIKVDELCKQYCPERIKLPREQTGVKDSVQELLYQY